MARTRLLLEWAAIALLALAVSCGLVLGGGVSRLDSALYDGLVRFRAAPPSDRILIVAIDDASVAALGHWPWRRDIHAQALARMTAARPAAIAYDVLFTEPAARPAEDQALAGAMRRVPIALPILLEAPGTAGREFDATLPISPEREAAALGHVALPHDPDGSARAALLALDIDGHPFPHLAETAYRLANRAPSPAFARAAAQGDYRVFVPYAAAGSFRTVPFKDVLAGDVPQGFLDNKLILVGATAAGLGDRHFVAGAGTLPGVEVQANLLNALLADRFVQLASTPWRLLFAGLPSIILLLLFLRLRPTQSLLAALAIFAVTAMLPIALLLLAGIWIPPVSALLALALVYPLWGWRRLSAIHRAMSDELTRFGADSAIAPSAPVGLDPTGSNALALSSSIARLRDLKQFVADTIEGVADPLIVTTLSGEVLLANQPAQLLLDGPLDLSEVARLIREPAAEDVRLSDGRSFSPRKTALTGASAEQRGWILLLADITAIRAAERDREVAIEFLSHDMRSPQAAIVALVEGEPGKDIPESLARRLAGHARRTLRLAEDFVQFARLETAAFQPEEIDVADCLAEASDAVWPLANAKGVRIVVDAGLEPHCIQGEQQALTRTLLNLLDNAVKFSPEGGEVHCTLEAVTEEGARWQRVEIRDAGSGVPAEQLPWLFERFGPTSKEKKGLSAGLGLAYARTVAERHNGVLVYRAAPGGGACFTLVLPASPGAA
ncbi:CHASE2 domain-containing sensor protein [Sphingomonas kyeonggiensis]|uniref:histidine kinase n=1 Tax=Sphingomonas kyeonggiensis TaxID=1268553 RepID=A0A7W7K2Q0_9SPHN|nr:CHASE2 domain-containing protein [Sphingomonas kyeonggiensis]MBB4839888.1 CHASE2 domain-containing sensor protein [Sphingomonas kyeonggiensis]